jgi:hypothetical protein
MLLVALLQSGHPRKGLRYNLGPFFIGLTVIGLLRARL